MPKRGNDISDQIVGHYGGDKNFSAKDSPTLTEIVNAPAAGLQPTNNEDLGQVDDPTIQRTHRRIR